MSTTAVSSILTNVNNAFSGKTTGIDVNATVTALMQVQRQPETAMQDEQNTINSQISALNAISLDLSQLQTTVNSLKDVFGALNQKSVTSSDSSVAIASADYTAAPGTHSVTVQQLASVSSSYSDPIGDASAFSGTQLTILYGDRQQPVKTDKIDVPAGSTSLQQVADAINASSENTGVIASVLQDVNGSRLVLTSKDSGADGNLTVSGPVSFQQGSAGENAKASVDGVPVESATNSIAGAVSGLTIDLRGAAPGNTVQIGIAPDTTEAANAVNSFITAYNTVIKDINTQFAADSSGNAGVLAGDSSLRTLQSQLLDMAGYAVSGEGQFVNLQSLGVEMQNDGTLQMNTSTLNDALSSHYTDFQKFFLSAQGFGQAASSVLLQSTDPTQGTIAADMHGLKATSNDLSNRINDFEQRITGVQQQLLEQYSNLNVLLEQYPMQMQQISSQLAALSSSKG